MPIPSIIDEWVIPVANEAYPKGDFPPSLFHSSDGYRIPAGILLIL